MPIFDPTLVQYFIQIPHIIFCCPLSAYDKWWFEQKKSPHFREKCFVLSYLKTNDTPPTFLAQTPHSFPTRRPNDIVLKRDQLTAHSRCVVLKHVIIIPPQLTRGIVKIGITHPQWRLRSKHYTNPSLCCPDMPSDAVKFAIGVWHRHLPLTCLIASSFAFAEVVSAGLGVEQLEAFAAWIAHGKDTLKHMQD